MGISNFHTHCIFCDGKQEPEAYVLEAIKKDFVSIGFTCHAPIPFGESWMSDEKRIYDYLKENERLKAAYKNVIEIYTGLEIDYFPGDNRNPFQQYSLDYNIGSVHFLKDVCNNYYSIDSGSGEFEKILHRFSNGNIRKMISQYYESIFFMVKENRPNIVGHFDLIKKNNIHEKYFSESEKWYVAIVKDVLGEIKKYDVIVEVNTGGIIRGYMKELYPSIWILNECKKLNIPIILNSDAHAAEELDGYFNEALSILKKVGYHEQTILVNQSWKKVGI